MKLEKKKIDVLGDIGITNKEATISVKDMPKLWEMLQNPYKNSIGSIVREITSNCFDSHAEAGVTDAVRIKISRDESGYFISFIDVGVGLSEDRIDTIYRQYLKSTKEDSNEFIGAFGLGSKSPLSYQDIFYINTIFDSVEYNYFMRKGEDMPVISLMEQKNTTERNGTEIKIYIKNEQDLKKFVKECSEQLMFFDNIVYDLDNVISYLDNVDSYMHISLLRDLKLLKDDFVLVNAKTFVFNSNDSLGDKYLCLSIGNVRYPIDWANLGIDPIYTPVALKFHIGELQVIQTREDIRYTDANIKVIKNRIEEFKEELIEIYNKKATGKVSLENLVNNYSSNKSIHLSFSNFDTDSTVFYNKVISLKDIVSTNKLLPPVLEDLSYKFKSLQDTHNFINLVTNKIGELLGEMVSVAGLYNHNNEIYKGPCYIKAEKSFNKGGAICAASYIKKDPYYTNSTSLSENTINNYSMFELEERFIKHLNLYKIFLTKDKKYTTKKNKFILEKMFEGVDPERVIILSKFEFKPSIRKLYRAIKDNTKDGLKKEEYKEIINIILNFIKDQFSSITTYDYDNLVVDEEWWKNRQTTSKNVIDYDRTLMAIEQGMISNYAYDVKYNREDFRPTIESYIKSNEFRIIIDKNEESTLISNSNGQSTFFENFIVDLNKYYSINKVKTRVNIHLTKTRNYNKILKYRKESSNIYTYKEFITNKKIWKRMISKLVTSIKIKDYIDKNLVNSNFAEFSSKHDLFSLLFKEEVSNDYKELMEYLSFRHHFKTDEMEQFIKEADAISSEFQIYDLDIINKFNKLLPLFKKHNIHLLTYFTRDIYKFTTNYRPTESRLALQPIYTMPLTEYSIIEYLEKNKRSTSLDSVLYDINKKYIPGTLDLVIGELIPGVEATYSYQNHNYISNSSCSVESILFLKYFNQIKENKITI